MIRYYSKCIIVLMTIALVVWDVYAYLNEENSTFSVIITDWSYYSPMFPFVAGVLMGHWFWPARGSND